MLLSDPPSFAVTLTLPDLAATARLAAALNAALRPGDVVALRGDLGAGKSALARAILRAAAGAPIEVPSPSFTLRQDYALGRRVFHHIDLYRLSDVDEAEELGLDEAFADGISLIEWPERLGDALPAARLDVTLTADLTERHTARLVGRGAWAQRLAALALSPSA